MQVVRDRSRGLTSNSRRQSVDAGRVGAQRRIVLEVADVLRQHARPSLSQAERVLQLGTAGQHRPGVPTRQPQRLGRVAAGSAQQHRPPATTRATESSTRVWIGRSCVRKASAMPPSRARASSSSNAIGSSETLPLVITSGAADGRRAAGRCSGVYGQHDADLPVSRRDRGGEAGSTRSRRRGGRAARSGGAGRSAARSAAASTAQISRASSRSATMTANGLSSRCFRLRRAPAAASFDASAARWKPPSPLTASTLPDRSRSAASPPGHRRSVARRPRSTPTVGRTPGSTPAARGSADPTDRAYSARARGAHREAGHRRRRPVVGHPRTMREAGATVRAVDEGVPISAVGWVSHARRRQSSQVALSAETPVCRSPPATLGTMVNPRTPMVATGAVVTASIVASGGASARSATRNASTRAGTPSTSMNTPATSLPTCPARSSRRAMPCTNGRNPTP